jgi:hypothetical protein
MKCPITKALKLGQTVSVVLRGEAFQMVVSGIDLVRKTVCFYSSSLGWILTVKYDQHGNPYEPAGITITEEL